MHSYFIQGVPCIFSSLSYGIRIRIVWCVGLSYYVLARLGVAVAFRSFAPVRDFFFYNALNIVRSRPTIATQAPLAYTQPNSTWAAANWLALPSLYKINQNKRVLPKNSNLSSLTSQSLSLSDADQTSCFIGLGLLAATGGGASSSMGACASVVTSPSVTALGSGLEGGPPARRCLWTRASSCSVRGLPA